MADNKKNQKIIDSYDYLANAASTQDLSELRESDRYSPV